jgi:hypothetical protein
VIARLVSRDSFVLRLATVTAFTGYVFASIICLGLIARFVWFLLLLGWGGLR